MTIYNRIGNTTTYILKKIYLQVIMPTNMEAVQLQPIVVVSDVDLVVVEALLMTSSLIQEHLEPAIQFCKRERVEKQK